MKLSLRLVVIGGVVCGLLGPLTAATVYTSSQLRKDLIADANAAHARAADVLALGVSKALWDLAPEGAIPLAKSVLDDKRIVRATILDAQGAVFHEEKHDDRRVGTVLTAEKPVMNADQTIGKVVVEFSLAAAEAEVTRRTLEAIVVSGIQALVCIVILVVLLNRRVLARVERLKREAQLLAEKRLDERFEWTKSDEIGELGGSLESTRQALKGLFGELEDINANLETIVEERTATIKMILNNVKSGFLLVDAKLVIQDGYTRSCEALLGQKDLASRGLIAALGLAHKEGEHFAACIDQCFEDFMPEEVTLDQIPQRVRLGERTLSLAGATVRGPDNTVKSILFTIVDVTQLEAAEKENRDNRALVAILKNIASFRDFVRDSANRLANARNAVKSGDEPTIRRELHTLKGNSSAFGLEDIAGLVHSVEDELRVANSHLDGVEASFQRFLADRYELLRTRLEDKAAPEAHEVTQATLQQLRDRVAQAPSVKDSLAAVETWTADVRKTAAETLLGPLQAYVENLAMQRGKPLRFALKGGDLRLDPEVVKPVVMNLVHLVRNSIDHGIESPDDRGDKDPTATLGLTFSERGNQIAIDVTDDGRGIDVERVVAKAIERGGLTAESAGKLTRDQRLELIFESGVSTAEAITSTSGRGEGMSSVRAAVAERHGSIKIHSEKGKGTRFEIVLPKAA